jgi:hypothetical protein
MSILAENRLKVVKVVPICKKAAQSATSDQIVLRHFVSCSATEMWLEFCGTAAHNCGRRQLDRRHWHTIYGNNTVAGVTVMRRNVDLNYMKCKPLASR